MAVFDLNTMKAMGSGGAQVDQWGNGPTVPVMKQAYNSSKVLGTSTKNTNSGSTNTGFNYQPTIPSPATSLDGGPSEIDAINQQFNDFNNYLNTQETSAQQNFTDTKGLYDTMKTNATNQYTTEKKTQTEQAGKTEALNLAKVRQLLGDLSQTNAARTAITGGGSATEAVASRFGRQAQQSLGQVMDATKQTIERVNQFYDNAITKLNDTYNSNILQAKQVLDDNLNQIRGARVQSAAAKQQNTINAWKSYYDTVNQAKLQAANFKAQYDMWQTQQMNALGATAGWNQANEAKYNTDLASAYGFLQNTPGVNSVQASPINSNYQIGMKKANTDEYGNPLPVTTTGIA